MTTSVLCCPNLIMLRPLLLQNGILICILIDGVSVSIIDKGHELPEQTLPAHTQLLAEALRRQVVVLGVGIDLPHPPRRRVAGAVCQFRSSFRFLLLQLNLRLVFLAYIDL